MVASLELSPREETPMWKPDHHFFESTTMKEQVTQVCVRRSNGRPIEDRLDHAVMKEGRVREGVR